MKSSVASIKYESIPILAIFVTSVVSFFSKIIFGGPLFIYLPGYEVMSMLSLCALYKKLSGDMTFPTLKAGVQSVLVLWGGSGITLILAFSGAFIDNALVAAIALIGVGRATKRISFSWQRAIGIGVPCTVLIHLFHVIAVDNFRQATVSVMTSGTMDSRMVMEGRVTEGFISAIAIFAVGMIIKVRAPWSEGTQATEERRAA